ncbi:HAMP domain-containing protein [Actinomycetes bacterium M1A6_2h]
MPSPERSDALPYPGAGLSMHRRVLLLTTALAAIAVAACSIAIYVVTEDALRAQIVERVERNAAKLAVSSSTQVSPDVLGFANDGTGPMRVAMITAAGEFIAQDGSAEPFETADGQMSTVLQPLIRGESAQVSADTDGYLMCGITAVGGDIVLVAEPESTMAPTLHTLVVWLGVLGGLLILFAAAVGAVAAGIGLRPVERLTRATRRVAAMGDLTPITVTGKDELAQLAVGFNAMLRALDSSRARQSQLVEDAGAELQAPLTALRTNIELLITVQASDGAGLDEATQAALRSDVVDQLDELTGRIHRLVEDAREAAPQ